MPTKEGDSNTYDITISSLSIGLTGKRVVADDGSFNDTAFKTAAEYAKDLNEKGALTYGIDNSMGMQMFIEGKVGFIIAGPWVPSGHIVNADPELRPYLKVTPLPATELNGVAGGVSNSLSVPKDISKEKKELVADFIRLYSTKKWQKEYGETLKTPPARLDVYSEEELKEREQLSLFIDVTNYAINVIPRKYANKVGEYRDAITVPFVSYLQKRSMEDSLNEVKKNLSRLN